jgi:outer membrane biosynthesis protein TonB
LKAMTHNNNPTNQLIEDVPPSGIDAYVRRSVTDYTPEPVSVIDTGSTPLQSPTVRDIVAQREDNPFLRLAVIAGVMGLIAAFLWIIFAILSPKAPEVAKETPTQEKAEAAVEPDYQAKLAFRDQFHSLEIKTEAVEPEINATELPPAVTPPPLPTPSQPIPQAQIVARPIPRPAPPLTTLPILRAVPQAKPELKLTSKTTSSVDPQEQWQTIADFGTEVSSRSLVSSTKSQSIANRRDTLVAPVNPASKPTVLLASNNSVSQGELGILNRHKQASFPQAAQPVRLNRAITKGKIELPLVWDSSLASEQQQSNQITVVLEEPIYDLHGDIVFDSNSVAILQVDSINDANGLVTAYVTQIEDTSFAPGELILRNQKKSALIAKASKRSNFGNQLLVGGVDTLSSFGQQILIPETNSTVSNGSAIVTSQSRNSLGRDLAGSALDGFGSSLSTELNQRSSRNQIGDGGTIFTLSAGTTVYLTNIQPIQVNR